VGFLGMSVAMLTVVVSRRRMLLGLVVLPVGMMVSCLQVMVRGSVMVCGGHPVMLDRRVFGLLRHRFVLLEKGLGIGGRGAPTHWQRSTRR
jgi:ABC-type transport system involved in cytochrome c biogenesis permease component